MSHKASSWLAEIPAEALTGAQFRVLFHLCDAHNSKRSPETACFPSQERLREATGLSNGGLNNTLNALEAAGFIRRRRTTEPGTSIQRTYYILGCDLVGPHEQTPESGVSANSTFDRANSSFSGGKLHSSGEYPVSNRNLEQPLVCAQAAQPSSERRHRASARGQRSTASVENAENGDARSASVARFSEAHLLHLATWINAGGHCPPSAVSNVYRDALLERGLVTAERLRELQIY